MLEAMLTVTLEPVSALELADVVERDVADVVDTLQRLRAQAIDERRASSSPR
jgi:predicted transcriptional regulator